MIDTWIQVIIAFVSGGGVLKLFDYMRGVKKDAAENNAAIINQGQNQLMTMWQTITKEQHDWRQVLQGKIAELETKLGDLTIEKNQLIMRIAELEAHNKELVEDNVELNQRVEQLKAELEQYKAKVA